MRATSGGKKSAIAQEWAGGPCMRARNTFSSLSGRPLDSHGEESQATDNLLEATRELLELAGLNVRQADFLSIHKKF